MKTKAYPVTDSSVVLERHEDRNNARYIAIKVDSAKWRAFIVGGALACAVALLPAVEVFDEATVRSLVFAGGISTFFAGLLLRRRFKSHISGQVRRIIDRHE